MGPEVYDLFNGGSRRRQLGFSRESKVCCTVESEWHALISYVPAMRCEQSNHVMSAQVTIESMLADITCTVSVEMKTSLLPVIAFKLKQIS